MKNNKKAFTLIELLVVIAIIGMLATISVIALSNARAKSRDAKRAGDMKQVQTALELFFNDNNRYPTEEEWATGRIGSAVSGVTSTYMQIIPIAPTPADGNCASSQNSILYTPSDDGTSYSISFCLGNTTGALTPGPKCLTPGGIIDVDCSDGEALLASQRDTQRLADINVIKAAMAAMYSANGYYFFDDSSRGGYRGSRIYNEFYGNGNCSIVTSEPGPPAGDVPGYGPCPVQSNWCIKLGARLNLESSGDACDSGTVYLRNIPLNNYLPSDIWATGWYPYDVFYRNNYDDSADYWRIKYRLEGAGGIQSDHFVNGVAASCVYNPEAGNSMQLDCE